MNRIKMEVNTPQAPHGEMAQPYEPIITESFRAKLSTMIDMRCIKLLAVVGGIAAVVTVPLASYAYISDRNHIAERMALVVESNRDIGKKIDSLVVLSTTVALNAQEIANIKKNIEDLRREFRSRISIVEEGN